MPGRRMHPPERVEEYAGRGWWTDELADGLFRDRVAAHPDRPAAVDPANKATLMDTPMLRQTWRELDADVDRLAEVLLDHGLEQGDVLAVQLPNSVELIHVYLAAWRIGAIVSPLAVQYREHELVTMGTIAQFDALVTAGRIGDRPVAANVAGFRDKIPSLRTVLAYGVDLPADVVDLGIALEGARDPARVSVYVEAHPADPNDCLTICWTSGTETAPKGVPRAHYEWLAMSWACVEAPRMTGDDVLLNPFPMVNMAGISGMFLPWLRTGAVLVQHQPFDLGVFLRQVAEERVTYTVAPPALLALLLQNEAILGPADITSLKQIGSGSVPLQEWMVRGWSERHGIDVINFFGSNEGIALMTDPVRMTDPAQRARYFPRYGGGRSWSFRAADWMSVKLVDPATGEEVTEAGRPGELRIKGPTIFAGYLDAAHVADPFDADGYLQTGDLFVIAGEDGEFLQYVDRAKDMVIRGGMNIAPAELEGLIATHPAVADVSVIGVPDDVLGERVCAVVVPKPGEPPTLEAIVAFLEEKRIASYKLPERLVLVEGLPRNPVGKVLKRDLRATIKEGSRT